ncbi:MAG: Asp-tRNA(Asn)/Glu-tRNA(Gln) amidotransferase subunit GatC [Candidatus Paceibacterota bacterium]
MEIKDLETLAELARLELPEDEKQSLLGEFSGILEYVDMVRAANVDDVVLDSEHYNAWREDEYTERDFDRESILQQFPDRDGDFLKVKKIL